MNDNEIRLGQEVGRMQEQNKLLQLMNLQLKQQIEKMKCCGNCKHYCINDEDDFDCCRSYNCTKFDKWELAEV